MLWVQNYHFYIIQNNWDKYQYKNKKHSPPKHKQKFQKCIKSDGSTPLIIELGSQYITFVVPELSQGHKCSKHLKNLRGIKKKKAGENFLSKKCFDILKSQKQQLRGDTEVLVQRVKVQIQNFSLQPSQQSSHSPSLQGWQSLQLSHISSSSRWNRRRCQLKWESSQLFADHRWAGTDLFKERHKNQEWILT